MVTRIKRTYNLSPESVEQVRRLVGETGLADSQDGIVELAIERRYREVRSALTRHFGLDVRPQEDGA